MGLLFNLFWWVYSLWKTRPSFVFLLVILWFLSYFTIFPPLSFPFTSISNRSGRVGRVVGIHSVSGFPLPKSTVLLFFGRSLWWEFTSKFTIWRISLFQASEWQSWYKLQESRLWVCTVYRRWRIWPRGSFCCHLPKRLGRWVLCRRYWNVLVICCYICFGCLHRFMLNWCYFQTIVLRVCYFPFPIFSWGNLDSGAWWRSTIPGKGSLQSRRYSSTVVRRWWVRDIFWCCWWRRGKQSPSSACRCVIALIFCWRGTPGWRDCRGWRVCRGRNVFWAFIIMFAYLNCALSISWMRRSPLAADPARGVLPPLWGLAVHVLPALAFLSALLPAFLVDLQLGIVGAVFALDWGKSHSAYFFDAAVFWDEQTAILCGEDVAAVRQDIPRGFLFWLFAGLHGWALFFYFGRQGDQIYPPLFWFRDDDGVDERIEG